MKRQISFRVLGDRYQLELSTEDNNRIFEIAKKSRKLDAKKFYKSFFEGMAETIDYELVQDGTLDREAKYYFETLKGILADVCASVNETCFSQEEIA